MKLRFANTAETDLEEIADWIANDNPSRAVSFVDELRKVCRAICDVPLGYPEFEAARGIGVRKRSYRDYLIFYRVDDLGVLILHIVHGSREYTDLAFDDRRG